MNPEILKLTLPLERTEQCRVLLVLHSHTIFVDDGAVCQFDETDVRTQTFDFSVVVEVDVCCEFLMMTDGIVRCFVLSDVS